MITVDLFGLNNFERESLYMDLEHRYNDYTWTEAWYYNSKYVGWTWWLEGIKDG